MHDGYAGPYRDRPFDNRNPGRENQQYLNCNRQKGQSSGETTIETTVLSGHGENKAKPHQGTDKVRPLTSCSVSPPTSVALMAIQANPDESGIDFQSPRKLKSLQQCQTTDAISPDCSFRMLVTLLIIR